MSVRPLPPLFLLLAAISALVPVAGGSPYWPMAGFWALALAIVGPSALGTSLARPAVALAVLLAVPAAVGQLYDWSLAPSLQFVLLPPAVFLLALLTLRPRTTVSSFLVYGLSALLADAFFAVSGLAMYYLDRIAGTSLVPSNAALMWHLSSGLLGILGAYLLFAGAALLRERRQA